MLSPRPLLNASNVAKALGGRRVGGAWMARCPSHEDGEPSLSLRDSGNGTLLVCCHARCSQATVISALRTLGLWEDDGRTPPSRAKPIASLSSKLDSGNVKRTAAALVIWHAATPAEGTLVETYLASRGLYWPVPATIRFHASLKHPSGGMWPAMIAMVTRGSDDAPLAVHRTFLARDGLGKAAISPTKMMLGPCGGAAVRLAMPGNKLMVGEGIETCLAAMQATRLPAWAALSTSGLRGLALPAAVRDVIVLADGDAAGEEAAQACAWRLKREGRRVRIARPPRGMDFNDLLLSHPSDVEEEAP